MDLEPEVPGATMGLVGSCVDRPELRGQEALGVRGCADGAF